MPRAAVTARGLTAKNGRVPGAIAQWWRTGSNGWCHGRNASHLIYAQRCWFMVWRRGSPGAGDAYRTLRRLPIRQGAVMDSATTPPVPPPTEAPDDAGRTLI